MKQTVHTFICRNQLLQHNEQPVLVALSGGGDSVALLHLLRALQYKCVAAHCNFHLRGAESDRDEQFVTSLCQKWQIQLYKQHFNTTEYATEHKISIEMAARELRYAWFEELRQTLLAQAIAVAHHADDQIETMLLNLIRGTGLKGLCGMAAQNGAIVRPLLRCSRKDIENYLQINHLQYVTDSTNVDEYYKRNKIRHSLLPLLEELNPNIRQTLVEERNIFDGYWKIGQQYVTQKMPEIVEMSAEGIRISINKILREPSPEILLYELMHPYGFHADVVAQLYETLSSTSGKQFEAEKYKALKDRNSILISPINKTDATPRIIQNIRSRKEKEIYPTATATTALFDAAKLTEPLRLRHWQTGDSFYPIGMKNKRKLSDFFSDEKLNLFQKQDVWLLLSGKRIVWIIGHRIDDRFKITSDTKQVMEITITNLK